MESFEVKPVAFVKNKRKEPIDDNWGNILSEIVISDEFPDECLDGVDEFSHLEIVFIFHKSQKVITKSEHPRENPNWPKTGIFAQRKKDRPNHLGTTIVTLIKKNGRKLIVKNLDAIDGTPVLDIKPVFAEFLPDEKITQPEWTAEIMRNYW